MPCKIMAVTICFHLASVIAASGSVLKITRNNSPYQFYQKQNTNSGLDKNIFKYKMRLSTMYITAICGLFLIKLRWPKKESSYKFYCVSRESSTFLKSLKDWVTSRVSNCFIV